MLKILWHVYTVGGLSKQAQPMPAMQNTAISTQLKITAMSLYHLGT